MATHILQSALEDFHRDGFVLVKGLFAREEMKAITAAIDAVADYPEIPGKYMMYFEDSLTQPGKRLLSRVEDFCPYHVGLDALAHGAKMLGSVSALFGEPAVLFKDKINFKLPGGSGFAPHQDVQAGWDVYASLYITAMVTIDAATPENGCLEMVSGQHRQGLIGELWQPLTEESLAEIDFVPYSTTPGDAIFFDSYAPHRSGPNLSDHPRRVLYITYNRLSEGDQRRRYYADKRKSYPPDCEREAGKRYVFRV